MNLSIRERILLNIVIILGLFFSVTNLIPISVIPFIVFSLLAPFIFVTSLKIPKVSFWTAVFFTISIINILVYSPNSFIDPSFYRWDGNFFVSFLPLLFLPLLPENNINIKKIITIFVIFAILSNLIFVIYQTFFGFTVTGLFLATNAFGGFMMIVLSFAFSNFFYSRKNTFNLIILGLAVMLLLMSYSRGSILAIAAAIICVFFNRRGNFFITRFALLFIVLTQAIILYFTYPVYEASPFDAYAFAISGDEDTKVSNIFIRVYENWPRGLHMFLHSPIFGTGIGSANDLPHILEQNSYIQFNQNSMRIYNSAHAHHTFLHVMGEMGIIGLIILIMLLKSIYFEIIQTRYDMPISVGLEIAFFALIFASFTEHRLFSPSNVFPFVLIFLLNYKNFNMTYKNEK